MLHKISDIGDTPSETYDDVASILDTFLPAVRASALEVRISLGHLTDRYLVKLYQVFARHPRLQGCHWRRPWLWSRDTNVRNVFLLPRST